MSLINQVLQNVEARQGNAALDGKSDAGWGTQVKPVLSHQGSSSGLGGWIKKLFFGGVLLAFLATLFMNWPLLMAKLTPTPVATPVSPVANTQPVAAQPKAPPAVAAAAWEPPQLTKSLFSAWHTDQASAATSVNKPASAMAPVPVKKVAAPQVEGEFTIQPADPKANEAAGAVVSVIEPPLEPANAVKPGKAREEESGPRGVVNKQVRPEQEVNILIQRAVDHEQKGRLNEALVTLRQALNTYPQSEDARQLLASYLFESKQEPEAVAVLQAGIKQNPSQIGLAKSLAKWQLSHAQPDGVLQTLKPVANLVIQDAESQWMLAMAYQQTSQHAAALPHFERATVLQPGRAQWMIAYAISLQAAGQSNQALQQLQQAYQLPLSERLSEFVSQRIRQLGGAVPTRNE